jgi:hypothetical protein
MARCGQLISLTALLLPQVTSHIETAAELKTATEIAAMSRARAATTDKYAPISVIPIQVPPASSSGGVRHQFFSKTVGPTATPALIATAAKQKRCPEEWMSAAAGPLQDLSLGDALAGGEPTAKIVLKLYFTSIFISIVEPQYEGTR